MSDKSINEELLEIIKALSAKIETLEKTVYSQDNLLMKSGYVVAETPTPIIDNVIGSSVADVSSMDWSDIHKMVENAGGQ
jgi:hypothetical protein|tara:strand:+ start:467 stop:706 length:240 start_codon:yes stop_codon:yes gene_type:complete